VIAITLTVEMQSLLIGESASEENIERMQRSVESHSRVNRIIDLRTQHIGPEELLIAGKIDFDQTLTNTELTNVIDEIEASLRQAIDLDLRIYLEPDQYDTSRQSNP